MEIWKDVLEYEGYYQVSNCGNVKSLSRTIFYPGDKNRDGFYKTLRERILKPSLTGTTTRYYGVDLCKDGTNKYSKIYRLEYEAFFGKIPDGMTVNHIDTNSLNDKLWNLELITQQENLQKAKDFHRNNRKYSSPKIIVTNMETKEVINFENASEASRFLNVSDTTVRSHAKKISNCLINGIYQIEVT